ncbi:MAG: adenylate cyclase [Chthoniobacter sp.]|jgi:adenylate cyclase|nr:adenylate cyclase [Chthoniobacter sp.]
MDPAVTPESPRPPSRHGLFVTALSPLLPQFLGSWFNIWYNAVVVDPLLTTDALKHRFTATIIGYNLLVYPLAVSAWLWIVFSLRPPFQALLRGAAVEPETLARTRRRVIHLPWFAVAASGAGWLLCIPVFLASLASVGTGLSKQLLWHLPISFLVSSFISITQSFFLVELVSHWGLFPVFFKDERPDRIPGIHPLSLRARGLMWAISIGICPIGSLLLLSFAPPSPDVDPVRFEFFVGSVGIAFGLCSAMLMSRLVAEPVDQLRAAAQAVAQGRLDVHVPLRRADEFGALIGEFNHMVAELREKERLRQTFGLHVGHKAAAQILARDPGLSGSEQVITVMFVDIRAFTSWAATCQPQRVVAVLNEFLTIMVHVVEGHHSGMINKFLGDGFMALFGAGQASDEHADEALHAALAMLAHLDELNARFTERGEPALGIGIGLHTGPAIVGSIGSPERLEFTAIGSTVNLASRIEGLTKLIGQSLIVSDATRQALRRPAELREFPAQYVKGLDEPVRIWGPARSGVME